MSKHPPASLEPLIPDLLNTARLIQRNDLLQVLVGIFSICILMLFYAQQISQKANHAHKVLDGPEQPKMGQVGATWDGIGLSFSHLLAIFGILERLLGHLGTVIEAKCGTRMACFGARGGEVPWRVRERGPSKTPPRFLFVVL